MCRSLRLSRRIASFNVDLPRFLASSSLRSLRNTPVELTANGLKDVTGLTKSNTEKTAYNVAFTLPHTRACWIVRVFTRHLWSQHDVGFIHTYWLMAVLTLWIIFCVSHVRKSLKKKPFLQNASEIDLMYCSGLKNGLGNVFRSFRKDLISHKLFSFAVIFLWLMCGLRFSQSWRFRFWSYGLRLDAIWYLVVSVSD